MVPTAHVSAAYSRVDCQTAAHGVSAILALMRAKTVQNI